MQGYIEDTLVVTSRPDPLKVLVAAPAKVRCTHCKGTGEVRSEVQVGGCDYETRIGECADCRGTGRVGC